MLGIEMMVNDCDTLPIGICCCHGAALKRQPYGRGSTGDGIYEVMQVVEHRGGWAVLLQQCHPNSAGSLVIARRTEYNPHCFCCYLCVVGYPQNWGKRPRYIA